MRKLAYKVMIDAIEPMDADTLECARVKGWRIVVRKGEFKPGDVALYFEVDSSLNPYDSRYAFLKERCYKKFMLHGKLWDECLRIRSMKLRGVISQGLLLPTEQFCEIRNMKVGEDCTALLAVRHYDEMAERVLQMTGSIKPADQKGPFPSFIPKTDEERIQNVEDETLEQFADMQLEISVKLDGSSCTVFYAGKQRPDDPFGICSRNFELKPGMGSWWEPVRKYDLQRKLEAYCTEHNVELALQGELVGPGMNSNRDQLTELDWKVFRIWNIGQQCWLNWNERYDVCDALDVPHVPLLGFKSLREFGLDRDKILAFAEGTTENGHEREGVVFKSLNGGFSFKAVSNRYLLGLK